MLRGLIFFLKLAVVVAVAVWLAERPGEVVMTWQGYRIETTVGLLLLGVLVVAVLASLAYRLWRGLRGTPGELGRLFKGRRQARGYEALTHGMVSVAAGEPDEARRYARKADQLLGDPPLTRLLSAQAAQLNGDDAGARAHYRAMLDNPETRFVGLRGLFRQAERDGDREEALNYVRRARQIRPETPWVLTALFDLSVRTGDMDGALEAVADMQRHGRLDKVAAKRRRAVLQTAKAQRAVNEGRHADAREPSKQAHDLAPGHAPAAVVHAQVQLHEGERRRAARTLETTWSKAPHPDLVAPYLRARKADTPMSRYRQLHKLTDKNPGHRESELALGRAAMAAELWGEARKHLGHAGGETPSKDICRLMAELEERENGDREAASAWLRKAADAPADPVWICESCGAEAAAWHAVCPHCDSFDSFSWRPPVHLPDALAEPATQAQLEGDSGMAESEAAKAERPNVPDAEVEGTERPESGERETGSEAQQRTGT